MTQLESPSSKPQSLGSTVKDVAAYAGVSTATVSRVLSGKGGVRKELAQRVLAAVEALDYHPNQAARRLRERSAKIIGVIVPDIQIPFFASIVVGIEQVIQEAGYLLILGNTNDQPASEQGHLKVFLGEDVSGIIFATSTADDTSHYHRLFENGIGLVAIDRSPGDLQVDTVQVANASAANLAVMHFLQEGYTRIGLITGPSQISTAVERQDGYIAALQSSGIHYEPHWIQCGDYTQEGGYTAMRTLFESPDRPSAVLIANNVMTLGALQYIHDQNIEIPCDLALISFDDMPWASSLRPPLTVIAQPVTEIGRVAARLMLDRLAEPNRPVRHITLETKLILRASCGCGIESALVHRK